MCASEPTPTAQEIINDPAASFWLKQAIQAALKRDPVDALNDAIALTLVLAGRVDEITTRHLSG